MSDFQNSVVDLGNCVADNDLILAICLNDLDDAIGLVQDIRVCLALIHQLEPQTGDAVGDRFDVLFAADILDNNAGETIILACHV